MKLRLLILLAAALAASPAAGQTIKSLGYNTTNGNIVAATNVTFTNSVGFSTNARAATRTNLELGATWLTNTNVTNFRTAVGLGTTNTVTFGNLQIQGSGSLGIGGMELAAPDSGLDFAFKRIGATNMVLSTNGLVLHVGSYSFSSGNTTGAAITRTNLGGTTVGNAVFTAANAATAATTIGLGTTNSPTFSNITATGTLGVSNTATFATNVTVNGNLSVGSLTTTTPSTWALDATQTAAATNGILALPSNANVIRLTNNTAISGVSGGVLGAFYFVVNQATNAVTISNVGGITIDGAQNLTLSPNESATLVATGATNASVAARGDLNNVTLTGDTVLSGVNNTMPNATNAASASSLMTRDLVGQEFANPRTKMQTTYWFGLEGLGLWQAVNSMATVAASRGPKFGSFLAFYTGAKPATSASGGGLRLGANNVTGQGSWRPIDGGAFTARTHMVNPYSESAGGNRAVGFSFASPVNTNFWAASDSFGLFWVQQPTNSWASNAVVAQHDRISVSNVVWAVSTTGTNGATEPTWTDLIGSLVTNGSAVYRNIGPHTSNNWVLAIGHTNASQVVMTNTGKTNWLRTTGSGHEVLLTLRYGTNTTAPYTVYGSVADGTGQGAEVALNLPTNTIAVSPQYWLRFDSTNTSVGTEAAGIRYFSIDAETPPLN